MFLVVIPALCATKARTPSDFRALTYFALPENQQSSETNAGDNMIIREMRETDIEAVAGLEEDVWAGEAAGLDQIRTRWHVCPEGSIVAVLPDGTIGGYAAAQRVRTISTGSWNEQTDRGLIRGTHCPDGPIAYGVNMSVAARAAKFGISGAIIQHYAEIFVRRGGCSVMCLGSRLPGYRKWAARCGGNIRDYLAERRHDHSIDPEMRLYEKAGFRLLWEIPQYFPDQRSGDYGAMIAMNRWDATEILLPAL